MKIIHWCEWCGHAPSAGVLSGVWRDTTDLYHMQACQDCADQLLDSVQSKMLG